MKRFVATKLIPIETQGGADWPSYARTAQPPSETPKAGDVGSNPVWRINLPTTVTSWKLGMAYTASSTGKTDLSNI